MTIVAVIAGPALKWVLGFFVPKVPDKFKPLIAPVVSILGWVVASFVADIGLRDVLTNALLTAGGAVITHDTVSGLRK